MPQKVAALTEFSRLQFLNNGGGIFPLCGNLSEAAYSAPPVDRAEALARMTLYWQCRAAAGRAAAGQAPDAPVLSEIGHYYLSSISAAVDAHGPVTPGCEIGENINSINMHLAHVRGAARQFGQPYIVDFSAWMQGAIRDYSRPPGFWGSGVSSPVGGHSLSLFKRS